MIKALPPILEKIEFDEAVWDMVSQKMKCPIVILGPESKGLDTALKILQENHYSNAYKMFEYQEVFSESRGSVNNELLQLFGKIEFEKIRSSILYLFEKSLPIENSVNGIFILIRSKGVETREHVHTFDVLFEAGPQRVFWWNRDRQIGNFWFQSDSQKKVLWPPELSNSNYYELDTKLPHGGDAVDRTTIFFITICRKFKGSSSD